MCNMYVQISACIHAPWWLAVIEMPTKFSITNHCAAYTGTEIHVRTCIVYVCVYGVYSFGLMRSLHRYTYVLCILLPCPLLAPLFSFFLLNCLSPSPPVLKVTREEAEAWCKSNGNILYFETSAKNSTNLADTFQGVARAIVKVKQTMEDSSLQNPTQRGVILKQNTETTSRSDSSTCNC